MKKYYLLILLLFPFLGIAQQPFSLNQGGASHEGYFTTLLYENVRGKIIVKVTINSKSYRFIVDTGAPTMITKAVFDELKPDILHKLPVADANGRKDSLTVVNLKNLSIGEVIFNDIPTLVAKDSFIFDCHRVDGFIGSNLLRNSIFSISSNGNKIILTDQVEKLTLEKKQGSDLILDKSQSSPYLQVRLKGAKTGTARVLFDLGMEGLFDLALKHYAILEKENILLQLGKATGSSTFGLHGLGRDTLSYRLRLPELQVNGAKLKNVSVNTTTSENSRLGSELLGYGIITIDYKNKKFYFEPFKTDIDLYQQAFPVSITFKDNKALIGIIWDESLGSQIAINDRVVAIDDKDYANITLCDFIVGDKILGGKDKAMLTLEDSKGVIKKIEIAKK